MRDLTEHLIELIRRTSADLAEHGLSFIAVKHLHLHPVAEMEMA